MGAWKATQTRGLLPVLSVSCTCRRCHFLLITTQHPRRMFKSTPWCEENAGHLKSYHNIFREVCFLLWSSPGLMSVRKLQSQYFTLDFLNLSRATWYVYLIATKDYSEFRLQKRLQGCLPCQICLAKAIKENKIIHKLLYLWGFFQQLSTYACWCQTWVKFYWRCSPLRCH